MEPAGIPNKEGNHDVIKLKVPNTGDFESAWGAFTISTQRQMSSEDLFFWKKFFSIDSSFAEVV